MGRNCGDGTVDAVITEGFLVAVTTGQGPEANISGRAPAVQTPEAQCREGARGPGTDCEVHGILQVRILEVCV